MIHLIDLNFLGIPRAIASYLVRGPGGWLLIECGPASTVKRLESELARLGVTPAQVAHVLVTHIHLDHAGAAGWWARQGARIYVHAQGAPHLVDPSRLLASAARIYGDMMHPLWGETLPVPADQVVALEGGELLSLAGLQVRTLDTPGHARHHLAFEIDQEAFTGDVAAVRILAGPFTSLPAPPPEFDPESWQVSLARLRERKLKRLSLTHFGPLDQVERHLDELPDLIQTCTRFVQERRDSPREALVEAYQQWTYQRARSRGLSAEQWEACQKANPLPMSVDGILRYLNKRGTTSPRN